MCYSPAGRSVYGKTVPEVLSTARGRRPRDVLKAEGSVFLYMDRPKPVNKVFIFSAFFSENEHGKLVCKKSLYALYVALSQLKLTYN